MSKRKKTHPHPLAIITAYNFLLFAIGLVTIGINGMWEIGRLVVWGLVSIVVIIAGGAADFFGWFS